MRRLALLVVGAVLVLAAVPSSAAGGAVCTRAFPDAVGDADAPSPALYRPPATPGVDIRSANVRTDAERITVAITVGDLAQQPVSSTSTRVAFDLVVKQWVMRVFHAVQPVPEPAASRVDWTRGIELYGEVVTDEVDVTVTGDTVTLSVTYDVLSEVRGKQVRGMRVTGIDATTTTYYVPDLGVGLYPHQQYDATESARGAALVLGGPCPRR